VREHEPERGEHVHEDEPGVHELHYTVQYTLVN
jgi:hypothetical protein